MEESINIADKPIDIVYLWCDGNDPDFQARKQQYMPRGMNEDLGGNCRYFNNDELKYSLRSLEKYAPWINHVYLITDNQVPSWLNLDNPKISIIDHKDIFPREVLPLFNTDALETAIHKIPGLSEFFLYANDDMFFGLHVTPDFFFTREGFPIVRGSRDFPRNYIINETYLNDTYIANVLLSSFMVWQKTRDFIAYIPHHNIDAYRKSFFEDAELMFAEECKKTLQKRFRGENANLRRIVHCLDYVKNRAVFKQVDMYRILCKTKWENMFPRFMEASDSFFSNLHDFKKPHQKLLMAGKYKLFCLNDNPQSIDSDRRQLKIFFESMFPMPSQFEEVS